MRTTSSNNNNQEVQMGGGGGGWGQLNNQDFSVTVSRRSRELYANFKGAVSRISDKLANYKMPVKLRET